MVGAVPADRPASAVVDRPADVVVAAQVGRPRARDWDAAEAARARGRISRAVAGGEGRPDLHHEAVVVGQVGHFAGVLARAEVRRRGRRGPTIASALNIKEGAAIRAAARRAWVMPCTSGWFWQFVPIRFQRNAIASRRKQSTPRLARNSR